MSKGLSGFYRRVKSTLFILQMETKKAPPLSQIPFITLGRRSLPWERELGIPSNTDLGGLDKSDYPWVALLVFREDELEWTDGNGKTHLNIFKGENAILSSSVSPSLLEHLQQTSTSSALTLTH